MKPQPVGLEGLRTEKRISDLLLEQRRIELYYSVECLN